MAKLVSGLLLALSIVLPARAFDSGSSSFRNRSSALDQGGQTQTATSYKQQSAIGEVSATTRTAASYNARGGLMAIYAYPGQVTGLFASTGAAGGSISLQWTAPGDDGYAAGTAARAYVVKYSTEAAQSPALSDTLFNAAATVSQTITPANQGASETLTISGLLAGTSYYFAVKAQEADGIPGVLSAGATAQALLVPPGISTPTFASVATTTFRVSWTSGTAGVGYNPLNTTLYTAQVSTDSAFNGTLVSSQTYNLYGDFSGLWANTTYYARALAAGASSSSTWTSLGSTATLSELATGTTVYGIWVTSITVNWSPLAVSPSSRSAEGYVLEVSSRSDFEPLWTSSSTTNVSLSTLTASNLAGGVTYYFRVGTLNWNSVVNYATSVSTLLPVQLGVYLSTHVLTLPGLTNLNSTVLISTSIVITNTGNVAETYKLRTTTTTPGSPWSAGASQGADRYVLYSVINSTQPATNDFASDDRLADPYSTATANGFSMGNENGVAVPAGATRLLWFKLSTPVVTSTGAAQQLEIGATAEASP